ncbi:UDP-N-acetylhexosamine pyrophosphorylase [Planctomycetales bacterium]|nr:UDP-N-acetylhexosamine pyrophosphorylase [Planctomycetales bacterium]
MNAQMKEQLQKKLQPFHQEHLLTFWDVLSETERQQLVRQIENIDFEQINELYQRRNEPAQSLALADKANDPPAYQFSTVPNPLPVKSRKKITAEEAIQAGTEALRSGKVAAALVAGGQGTRLGFPHPKGMFPIAPVSGKTLFQIHFEKVLAASKKYGQHIPYCIMTSPATHTETVDFLNENKYFGMNPDDVFVFCQGTMPAVDLKTGKILLAEKSSLALSPDGHGGMLKAISSAAEPAPSGGNCSVLEKLKQRGIAYLFYHQVDSSLVKICSPEFLGYHILSGSELTSQVIRKTKPMDKVGNVVEADGHLSVIEYSDLPENVAVKTNPDGSLKIWAGSIAVHIFNTEFLEQQSQKKDSLPFHFAKKKVPFADLQSGAEVKPEKENAVKFEKFIFDLMPAAKNSIVVEVDPPNHYAPLKNKDTADCPETVKRDLSKQFISWLRQAGAEVADDAVIEISPLFADSPEVLKEKIAAGTKMSGKKYFG